jgi:predicted amidophosphoribosyltransferase
MDMTTCCVCGKIFGASSETVCPACRKLLEIVYEKARAFLRDNPKLKPNASELAREIGEDERLINILVTEGRFEKGDDIPDDSADRKKKKLLEELAKNMPAPERKSAGLTTYGNDRHGVGRDR